MSTGQTPKFIFQHRTFMRESAKTIEAMGVAEPRIVDAAVRQIVMPELYDRRVDACSARRCFLEHPIGPDGILRKDIKRERFQPRIDCGDRLGQIAISEDR